MSSSIALTANEAWLVNLSRVLAMGVKRSPRGRGTIEILNNTSVVDMTRPLITNMMREMGYRFVFAEAHWILSGDNRVETIRPYANAIANFSDNQHVFQGAYGPKITEQLRYTCDTLYNDPDSRQAVISIWRENPRASKDIPCTLTLQFLIRDGQLNCIANMRSSDLWLGWVYDVFNFSMISAWIAIELQLNSSLRDLKLGTLYLNAGSQHIYDVNVDQARLAKQGDKSWSYKPLDISHLNTPNDLMSQLIHLRDIRMPYALDSRPPSSFLVDELLANVP